MPFTYNTASLNKKSLAPSCSHELRINVWIKYATLRLNNTFCHAPIGYLYPKPLYVPGGLTSNANLYGLTLHLW